MKTVNPLVIPRNHNVEHVINESLKNNYEPLFEILSVEVNLVFAYFYLYPKKTNTY